MIIGAFLRKIDSSRFYLTRLQIFFVNKSLPLPRSQISPKDSNAFLRLREISPCEIAWNFLEKSVSPNTETWERNTETWERIFFEDLASQISQLLSDV